MYFAGEAVSVFGDERSLVEMSATARRNERGVVRSTEMTRRNEGQIVWRGRGMYENQPLTYLGCAMRASTTRTSA
jgi:hypothetical protein